ncbi:cytochrome P450 [Schizopora paradoxa]|uniref:Cytochrome P450 n=1 Tax=Schizopora paradoxa TaxID=27342 RepID=A0A0H2R792_9AGAM|nr:cytochrome P450 [Schizopora paradoxa]
MFMWQPSQFGFKEYSTCVLIALTLFVFSKRFNRAAPMLVFPPGPPRLPIIGNLHQMPLSHLWEKATEWGEQYGDLVYLENAGIPALVLNSYEVATELLDKRSVIYSSRPSLIMTNELQGWAWGTPMLSYGETLRKHRAYLHRFFQTPEVLNYFELQERETFVMLNGILDTPEYYAEHVRRQVEIPLWNCVIPIGNMIRLPGAVILRNVYGYEVQKVNDPMLQVGEKVLRMGADSMQYLFLDFLPWLKYVPEWFPGVTFPKVAREGRQTMMTFRFAPHEMVKKQFNEGSAKQSMTSILLAENMNEDGSVNDEQNISDASSIAFLGGTDTSVTAIMTFILAMLKNPDKQQRAQREIDAVIGHDRLPNLSDWDSLPYVRAICTEVFRWEVILPFGVAHSLDKDDEYMGYHIPAGTMVLPNIWAIARDARHYSDPLSFSPERWMPGETDEGDPSLRPQDYVFGFGRRTCPGKKWAEHIVFLAVASILATFNIEKGKTANGEIIPPNDTYLPSPVR